MPILDNAVPLRKGLWTVLPSDEPRLLGSRCLSCGEMFFPRRLNSPCTHCSRSELEPVELGPAGSIDSFTAVLQRPAGGYYRGPVPFCYGLIDLDEGLRVEAHIDGSYESLKPGMRVRLAVKTLYEGPDGSQVQTFTFAPVALDQA